MSVLYEVRIGCYGHRYVNKSSYKQLHSSKITKLSNFIEKQFFKSC